MVYKKDVSMLSPEEIIMIGAGLGLIGAAAIIGSQVAAGVFTGFVSAVGIAYTIFKARKDAPRIYNFIVDRPLMSDVVIDVGVFLIVGGTTVTGIVAGASASLFTSISLNGLRRLGRVDVSEFSWTDYLRKRPQSYLV